MHVPSSDLASSWRYDTKSIYQSDDELGGISLKGATINKVSLGEFNSDDKSDLVIPNYERDVILILEQDDWNKRELYSEKIKYKITSYHSVEISWIRPAFFMKFVGAW